MRLVGVVSLLGDQQQLVQPGVKSNREIKRERNELTSQMISQLKQECARPEVVEVWDIRARDPKLLVYLKAYRNTVPVPRHWSQKRKYLQGKRGIEKPPFELPSFIQSTGTFRSGYVLGAWRLFFIGFFICFRSDPNSYFISNCRFAFSLVVCWCGHLQLGGPQEIPMLPVCCRCV